MKKRHTISYAALAWTLFASLILTACSGLLPQEARFTMSPWKTFEDVKEAYDSIELNKSKEADLQKIGFTTTTPNVSIMNDISILQRALAGDDTKSRNLPAGIKLCLEQRNKCTAYFVNPEDIKRKRYDNVMMDFLGFKKHTKITGWKFEALIVLVDGTVVYKTWDGTPNIEAYEHKKYPLGLFQNVGDMFVK